MRRNPSYSYGDVLSVWLGLTNLLGMEAMMEKASHGHECLRELLVRFRCSPSLSNPGAAECLNDVLEMIRFLTVLGNMTFTASMSGEDGVSELATWIGPAEHAGSLGVPEDWEKLKGTIRRNPEHFLRVIVVSLGQIKSLKEEVLANAQQIQDLISRVETHIGAIRVDIDAVVGS